MALQSEYWESTFYEIALLEGVEKAEAVTRLLEDTIKPQNLSRLFDEFVDATRSRRTDDTDSYHHDNGFDKIIVYQNPETRMKMRLHVWHPVIVEGKTRRRQNVHNHRWDFSSGLLLGEVDHVTYRFAEPGEPGEELFHYRYFARGSKEHYELEERGKAAVVETAVDTLRAGSVYNVANETLHRVDVPDSQTVATLIVTHENVGWVTNDLLSERSMGYQRVRLSSPAMTRQKLIEKVGNLRTLIGV